MKAYYKEKWITQDFVRSVFEYKDDLLYWKPRPRCHFTTDLGYITYNSKMVGKSLPNSRNTCISYKGKSYRLKIHCLVWLYHNDYMPAVIDHIDSDNLNHKIANLQPATQQLNCTKASMLSNNTSGYKGVHPCTRYGKTKWKVEIKVFQKNYCLGRYEDKHYAAKIYNLVAGILFGKYAFVNISDELNNIDIDISELNSKFFREYLPRLTEEMDNKYGRERDKIPLRY